MSVLDVPGTSSGGQLPCYRKPYRELASCSECSGIRAFAVSADLQAASNIGFQVGESRVSAFLECPHGFSIYERK